MESIKRKIFKKDRVSLKQTSIMSAKSVGTFGDSAKLYSKITAANLPLK